MPLEAASCGIDHYLLGIVEPSPGPGVGLGSPAPCEQQLSCCAAPQPLIRNYCGMTKLFLAASPISNGNGRRLMTKTYLSSTVSSSVLLMRPGLRHPHKPAVDIIDWTHWRNFTPFPTNKKYLIKILIHCYIAIAGGIKL